MSARARRRAGGVVAAALALAALAGCAGLMPDTTVHPAPAAVPTPAPQAAADTSAAPPHTPVPVGTTASGGTITSTGVTPAVVDSGPSREATEVLRSIPEPLPAGERVPAPAGSTPAGAGAAADSGAGGRADVPVPTPTPVLGQGPEGRSSLELPDSLFEQAPAAPESAAAAPESAAAVPESTAAAPDTCWRVQVAAPSERDQAETLRQAAQSQLLTPMVVDPEAGRFKVRTRDCLGRAPAEALRRRAVESGFDGAFLLRGKAR